MDIKYNTDTKVEDNSRMYKLQKANFDKEINTAVILAFYYALISPKHYHQDYYFQNLIQSLVAFC